MSSGSARAIAFRAASRSPLLIASSTMRTAPRIWVRRDLLTMVRRAILRVAFLAEVVLAMFSNYPSGDRSLDDRASARPMFNRLIDAGGFFDAPQPANPSQANMLPPPRPP